jgi:hypothetical protein
MYNTLVHRQRFSVLTGTFFAVLLLSGCQKSELDKCVEEQYDNYYDYINGLPFDQQGNALAVITDQKCGHLYGE